MKRHRYRVLTSGWVRHFWQRRAFLRIRQCAPLSQPPSAPAWLAQVQEQHEPHPWP
jgi:hypothetical protein